MFGVHRDSAQVIAIGRSPVTPRSTCWLPPNGLDPEAYLRRVRSRIASHPLNHASELRPWAVADQSPSYPRLNRYSRQGWPRADAYDGSVRHARSGAAYPKYSVRIICMKISSVLSLTPT